MENSDFYKKTEKVLLKEIKDVQLKHDIYADEIFEKYLLYDLLNSVVNELDYHNMQISDRTIIRELSLIAKSLLNQKVLLNDYDNTVYKYIDQQALVDMLRENNLIVFSIALSRLISFHEHYNELKPILELAIKKKEEKAEEEKSFYEKVLKISSKHDY